MDFQTSIRTCFSKFATFDGRAARPEYWWFVLFVFVGNMIAAAIDRVSIGLGGLEFVFGLVVLLPSLAVGARRLHDTDRSGWWLLLMLIPVIGILVLIYFFIQPGTPGHNRFGPEPLRAAHV